MQRSFLMYIPALVLMAAANLNVCCDISVNGSELSGSYSPACANECMRVSALAAEEICVGRAEMPELKMHTHLTLIPPENNRQEFTDSVLRETEGITLLKSVFVKGKRLGSVSAECDIRELLRQNIVSQQPNSAVYGIYSGEIIIEQCYGRTSSEADSSDMVLLVSGMAPVMYYDSGGERA